MGTWGRRLACRLLLRALTPVMFLLLLVVMLLLLLLLMLLLMLLVMIPLQLLSNLLLLRWLGRPRRVHTPRHI